MAPDWNVLSTPHTFSQVYLPQCFLLLLLLRSSQTRDMLILEFRIRHQHGDEGSRWFKGARHLFSLQVKIIKWSDYHVQT